MKDQTPLMGYVKKSTEKCHKFLALQAIYKRSGFIVSKNYACCTITYTCQSISKARLEEINLHS